MDMLLQFTKLERSQILLKASEIYQKVWIDIGEYPTCPYHAKLSEREVNRGGRCRLQILVTIVAHESFEV